MKTYQWVAPFVLIVGCAMGATGAEVAIEPVALPPGLSAVGWVEALLPSGTTRRCTATLVEPRRVLTAAHCVAVDATGSRPTVHFLLGSQFSAPTHIYPGVATAPATGYDRTTHAGDIATVELHVPAAASPVPISFVEPEIPLPVVYLGYGTAGMLRPVVSNVDERDDGRLIDRVEPGGPCGGDSGGPVLTDRSGAIGVAGVIAAGDPDCREVVVSVRVDVHRPFLIRPLVLPEPPPGALCEDTCATALDAACDDETSCAWGSDCTDCGGARTSARPSPTSPTMLPPPPAGGDPSGTATCSDTCPHANDGECDDGGEGSLYSVCTYGTDCGDCGPRTGTAPVPAPGTMPPPGGASSACDDSCATSQSGTCDDGGPGSFVPFPICAYGTDCSDCGAR